MFLDTIVRVVIGMSRVAKSRNLSINWHFIAVQNWAILTV